MMGQQKIRLQIGDDSFLTCIQEAMLSLPVVYLSVDQKKKYADLDLPLIEDAIHDAGPFGGILSAFLTTNEDVLLFLPCDMPLIRRADVDRMLDAYASEGRSTIAWDGERVQPLFAIYKRGDILKAYSLFQTGERRMMRLIKEINPKRILYSPESLSNINTPEAFRQILQKKETE